MGPTGRDGDVTLRILEDADADPLFALVDANRERLREWLPWVDATRSPEDIREFIHRSMRKYEEGNGYDAGVLVGGRLAGSVGLHSINRADRATSVGYWIAEEFGGRGVMTRAVRIVLDHCFGDLGLHRVEIVCAPGNVRSRAIPERLGFRQEGVLRDSEWVNDRFVDGVVYGLLEDEWRLGVSR